VSKSTFNRWRSLGITAKAWTPPTSPKTAPTNAGFVDLGALRAPPSDAGRLELTIDLGSGITLRVVRG
jgi:hypothetical protein